MTSLLINLYAKRNFTAVNHSDVTRQAVLSPTAIIQVKMLTRGGVAVELRREKSFPRWGLARNIGWGCGGLKILPHRLWWVCEKPPELYCIQYIHLVWKLVGASLMVHVGGIQVLAEQEHVCFFLMKRGLTSSNLFPKDHQSS